MASQVPAFTTHEIDAYDLLVMDLRRHAIAGTITDSVEDATGNVIAPDGATMICLTVVVNRETYPAEAVVTWTPAAGTRIGLQWTDPEWRTEDAEWLPLSTVAKANDDPDFIASYLEAIMEWLAQ